MLAMVVQYKIDKKIDYEKFSSNIQRRLLIHAKAFGVLAENHLQKMLRAGKYEENSPPWTAAKDSSRSLYHTGHLSTKLKNRVLPIAGNYWIRISVGWHDNKKHPARERGSGGLQTIVNWITTEHEWQPTAPQRRAFWAQVPKEWKMQNPSKFQPSWKAPARDFMTDAANDVMLSAAFLKLLIRATDEVGEGK